MIGSNFGSPAFSHHIVCDFGLSYAHIGPLFSHLSFLTIATLQFLYRPCLQILSELLQGL